MSQAILDHLSNFQPGDEITLEGYSYNRGTFVEYGPPEMACCADHVSSPSMRIAYVDHERYGLIPVWEDRISYVGSGSRETYLLAALSREVPA